MEAMQLCASEAPNLVSPLLIPEFQFMYEIYHSDTKNDQFSGI